MALTNFVRRRFNQQAPRLGDILDHLHGKKLSGITHGTPGTAVNVAHGLTDANGKAVAPYAAYVAIGNGYISAIDATNIEIKSAAATQTLTIVVINDPGDAYKTFRKA